MTRYEITPKQVSVNEGAGTQIFTITRDGTLSAEIIYASTLQTEGSTNNGDYGTNVNNLPLTFGLNQRSQTVTISITNDTVVESNETFGFIVQRKASDPASTFLAKQQFSIRNQVEVWVEIIG